MLKLKGNAQQVCPSFVLCDGVVTVGNFSKHPILVHVLHTLHCFFSVYVMTKNRFPTPDLITIQSENFGQIESQLGRTYQSENNWKGLVHIIAPSSGSRIRLQFNGSVDLSHTSSKAEPGKCHYTDDYILIYEYNRHPKKRYLLPKICGSW